MTYKRNIQPASFATGEELTSCLIGIGFRFFGTPVLNPNIEDTLIAASIEGLSRSGRVQSLLVDWLEIHANKILADRLVNLVLSLKDKENKKVRIFWAAFAQMHQQDIRFKKLLALVPGRRVNLDEGADFLIQKNGEDPRFAETCLRVPQKQFRHRPEDILTPAELAKMHVAYRYRVLIGPTHRADMFAQLETNRNLTTYALAKNCYGSYRTAMAVKRDFAVLNEKRIK